MASPEAPTSGEDGKYFDMKEDLLEAWGPSDGIREIIANALDEQVLTGTDPVDIEFDGENTARIRDYGRGLRHEHFAQEEAEEKLSRPDEVIGKFGVGLKDALAVLYRHGAQVTIHSRHNTFTVEEAPKADFEDVETLHAVVRPPERPGIEGTEAVVEGITEADLEKAKRNFLQFRGEERIEETKYGEIYGRPEGEGPEGEEAAIYVTGLRVATEPDFLFSYNITSTTKNVRDALNRERSNVGRTAYTPRVKKILQEAQSEAVAERLTGDLEGFEEGESHDELGWKAVQVHAARLMNSHQDVVFTTVSEQQEDRDLLEHARRDGKEVITVPDNVREKIRGETDTAGNQMQDVEAYREEYTESFEYEWTSEEDLTDEERAVWDRRHEILELIDEVPHVEAIRISEQMRITGAEDWKTRGVWETPERHIVIHRPVLGDLADFAATLLHELAHPKSRAKDQTREFERALTEMLGETATEALGRE
ncbi:ATP-binding protein [Salinibacter ruber]|nr:ATP-binding protein [Salinibacter ruber]